MWRSTSGLGNGDGDREDDGDDDDDVEEESGREDGCALGSDILCYYRQMSTVFTSSRMSRQDYN